MSALQELQLLEIMCSCFQEQSRDTVRQLMFSALFNLQGNQADESRMALLGKLVSMAVAVGRVPILECAATWLQVSLQTHRTVPPSFQLLLYKLCFYYAIIGRKSVWFISCPVTLIVSRLRGKWKMESSSSCSQIMRSEKDVMKKHNHSSDIKCSSAELCGC